MELRRFKTVNQTLNKDGQSGIDLGPLSTSSLLGGGLTMGLTRLSEKSTFQLDLPDRLVLVALVVRTIN